MAHFYGTIQGARGRATRCGTKSSDIETTAASWEGSVRVRVFYDAQRDQDIAIVSLEPWQGRGKSRMLYHGPISGKRRRRAK